jgi:hypothetical protein
VPRYCKSTQYFLSSIYIFIMFSLLFLAATGVRAAFYDHGQIPLRTPGRSDVVVPLTVRTVYSPLPKSHVLTAYTA